MSAPPVAGSTRPDSTTDAALVGAYRTGDERAAAELVQRHAGALGRFLHSLGADPGDLEDLVQETLFRAFRRVDGWRGGASFRSWLLTIGSNLLRDQVRKRKGKLVPIDDRDIAADSDPHAELAALEAQERVREGLARLPKLQREVFLLRAQEGSDYEDIAAALGTTPGAARVHYHHAVKRLKELIG
ncbi:MAG TPA: sigma-70 family RNA polymerase sigma factor [Gemmatimonadales bacterium]|nr:sigma-70 family RNA polymerase sigma factor [Gemmatimonadales bacterium]